MANDGATDWVPESCSLPTLQQSLRVAEFDRLFSDSVLGLTRVSATRLVLALAADAEGAARDLAAREAGCCSFFTFEFASASSDVVMAIGVPESHSDMLDAMAARAGAASGVRPRR